MNRSFNIDDPLITAYALDELSDGEHQAVADAVASSLELQAAVARIREMADLLTSEFAAETGFSPAASTVESKIEPIEQTPLHPSAASTFSAPRRMPMLYSLLRSKTVAASIGLLVLTGSLVAWGLVRGSSPILGRALTDSGEPKNQPLKLSGGMPDKIENEARKQSRKGGGRRGSESAPMSGLGYRTRADQKAAYKEQLSGLGYAAPNSGEEDSEVAGANLNWTYDRSANKLPADLIDQLGPYESDTSDELGRVVVLSSRNRDAEFLVYGNDGGRFGGNVGGRQTTDTMGEGIGQTTGHIFGLGYVDGEQSDEEWTALGFPVEGNFELTEGLAAPVFRERGYAAESYDTIIENSFLSVAAEPLSTFSIDVDTASYSDIRRIIHEGRRPPKGAVRIEELVNYFAYDYAPPAGDEPFAFHLESADCPWQPDHRLVRVGIKGFEVPAGEHPVGNFVFLIDTSGSMNDPDKLPLVQQSLKLLVENLPDDDRVAIAVYAGAAGLVLDSTPVGNRGAIMSAIDNLQAGGSTNGGEGIQLAYDIAADNFIKDGTNRVILCTDGDFNVGITDKTELVQFIAEKAKTGVFLSVMGFGACNCDHSMMEQLADKGNGNYGYIDTLAEARKLFVEQLTGTLVTIAKDVKIQVEFNPAQAKAYRLIGYENRKLANQDFNDDTKDAGEIGAGHTVTALYEVVPVGIDFDLPTVDPLKYQSVNHGVGDGGISDESALTPAPLPGGEGKDAVGESLETSHELLTVKFRYKAPDGDESLLIEVPFTDSGNTWSDASGDFQFASAVAAFGMVLRDSQYSGGATMAEVAAWTDAAMSDSDEVDEYRSEFRELIDKAGDLVSSRSNP